MCNLIPTDKAACENKTLTFNEHMKSVTDDHRHKLHHSLELCFRNDRAKLTVVACDLDHCTQIQNHIHNMLSNECKTDEDETLHTSLPKSRKI